MTTYDDYGFPVGTRNQYPSWATRSFGQLQSVAIHHIIPVVSSRVQQLKTSRWNIRNVLTVGKVLTVLWLFLLYWGERSVFMNSIGDCEWENWESWSSNASPHRLVFVADPQLVDPHTYPGRPWPLSTLTVIHTDTYLRRAYSHIQKVLYPDTVVFLGDLFDGGREWSTRSTMSPEAQWRKYGDDFWLREYDRFGRIFFDHWGDGGTTPRRYQPGRKIISSLPGNHDLGFGTGIQSSVRKRFNAYFGDGNRIDIIGNHTFVSVDTVSLSALGQPQSVEQIWRPTMDFLDNTQAQKKRVVTRQLRQQQGLTPDLRFKHAIVDTEDLTKAELPHYEANDAEFPTILLTHVPLFRAEGTPCGPLREHWPPSPPPKGQTEPLEKDERNAIAVRGGYQYQNVLTKEISKEITEKVGNIQYAFSGDDHDYCEVVHRGYPSAGGGIREITVKSISWAMGVRKPGIVMLSLWNPVDSLGNPISTKEDAASSTLQSHLCLLPNQLAIFIRYATFFGITISLLTIRAALVAFGRVKSSLTNTENPILPVSEHASSAENEKAELYSYRHDSSEESSSKSSASSNQGKRKLSIRNSNARTRSVSPAGGYGLPATESKFTYPLIQHAGYFPPTEGAREFKQWENIDTSSKHRRKKLKGLALLFAELRRSVIRVALVVFMWYFWLSWNG
ncbi:hypothetical protein K432DRAFT_344622 [Lepidopterella palustris CBS 459.81]|uniref:Calcineurin-like phosphoesterase domain-containing protein n=1 Tax=Lepidopterella palustris CBS 459.81 TaxID=1314670 RepID=A0A8E2JJC2_9PEZI|nr:hypothetical protein K432DRAFT_344622 [Lepidopterella palustris CBS 459.81]